MEKKKFKKSWWVFLPTNTIFENRKEAKTVLGSNRFKKLLEEGKVVFRYEK